MLQTTSDARMFTENCHMVIFFFVKQNVMIAPWFVCFSITVKLHQQIVM